MDENTVTLIIGLAGFVSTLIVGGLGIYFTAKARSSSLREALFNKQLELVTRIMHQQGRFRVFASILAGERDAYKEMARGDIGNCIKVFSEIQEESSAILPTELWIEVKKLNDQMTNILVKYDEENGIPEDSYKIAVGMMTKIGLLSRTIIGADELTEESLSLFSSKKGYNNLANIEICDFIKMQEKKKT